MMKINDQMRLIESDTFPFEFLSQIAERESWRKEVHRPIYHVHKWWAKRLGSIFRGILLGSTLSKDRNLESEFYKPHAFSGITVFDPFMGSGTTIGEAHKLGYTSLGRDINPVAVDAVQVALGPIEEDKLQNAFDELSETVGNKISSLYKSKDAQGNECDVLYYFWVMQTKCVSCTHFVDLFPSWVIAKNAYPKKKPEVRVLCPSCGDIFDSLIHHDEVSCPSCDHHFSSKNGTTKGAKATCQVCKTEFKILDAINGERPAFRLYGKLVLSRDGKKAYLPVTKEDHEAYADCSALLEKEIKAGNILLPSLELAHGNNTKQAISYGFKKWCDFFNDRQLLALGLLWGAIHKINDPSTKDALMTLFSGALEFNNMFASYKGEGTGAVRHMFSHHILKPERTPIEANVWGTAKSSGSFSTLFRSRLLRVNNYRLAPTEVNGTEDGKGLVCSPPFSGQVEQEWPENGPFKKRGIYLSCGDSAVTNLPRKCIDLVVTDPPFFDNVHYSELADFFFAWQQIGKKEIGKSTRSINEVQDAEAQSFSHKLQRVFSECSRVLNDEGLLIFTYHHSRDEGWKSLSDAILGAGFVVVNSQPVKAEMSVATPKSQTNEPIQIDVVLVCKKASQVAKVVTAQEAYKSAANKIERLEKAGFTLSKSDKRIILMGQLLTTLKKVEDYDLREKNFEKKKSGRVLVAA